MRLYIQWALATPQDYQPFDVTSIGGFRQLPRKPVPTTTSVLDDTPGWIASLNLQGVIFDGFDHIGCEVSGNALVVKAWNDDPRSGYTPGTRWGQVWTFAPPAPDIKFKNAVNTVQTVTWYGEADSAPVVLAGLAVEAWTAFTATDPRNTWHGIQMSDAQWAATVAVRTDHAWREWT